MTNDEYDVLRMHMSPHIDDDSEHGWEEITNAGMTHLLKTCLSKGGAQGSAAKVQNVNSQIKVLQDINKLK